MSVGLLGFGRFGGALGELLDEARLPYRAFDPAADVPARVRAGTMAEAIAGASKVVIAAPVPSLPDVLRQALPHLSPEQLVLDVGSVKVPPVAAMRDILGSAIPWIGTHPLFGPTSLALAERPLRVVVCPNPLHPDAARQARDFYETLGCVVIEQDEASHDRAMAATQALAFFIAKGMLDIGAGDRVTFAPPSFQAIARTIEAVRSDAGHLFYAIQQENPFAAEARQRLLAALSAVDQELSARRTTPPGPSPDSLTIPDLGARSPELRTVRERIDETDRELFALLVRRSHLSRRAAKAKSELGAAIKDPVRERALLDERRAWAREAGLEPEGVEGVFQAVLALSRKIQGALAKAPRVRRVRIGTRCVSSSSKTTRSSRDSSSARSARRGTSWIRSPTARPRSRTSRTAATR
jgi:prephenate dehydrogenase